jgi:hypothetical protein
LEELKRFPVRHAAKRESFSPNYATDQHAMDSHASLGDPHGLGQSGKQRSLERAIHLTGQKEWTLEAIKIFLDVRFLFA